MGKYDHIYNKNLVDLVNEQIDIDKLWDALYDYDTPNIYIWFLYIDGTNSVYKYERYFMDTIYFTDGISVDIIHNRLLNIKSQPGVTVPLNIKGRLYSMLVSHSNLDGKGNIFRLYFSSSSLDIDLENYKEVNLY